MTEPWGPKEWVAEEVTSQCRVILSYPVLCDSSTWPGTPSDAVQGNVAGQGTFLNSLVLSHNSPTKKQQPEMDSQLCTWPLPCVEENRTEILERPAHKGAGARLMFLVPFIDNAVMEFTAQDFFYFFFNCMFANNLRVHSFVDVWVISKTSKSKREKITCQAWKLD